MDLLHGREWTSFHFTRFLGCNYHQMQHIQAGSGRCMSQWGRVCSTAPS